MKITREVKTAILVLSGILLFIYIFNYLKGENIFGHSKKISAVYDNVEGLLPSSAVTINGHKIGKVLNIDFTNDGTGKLQVDLLIENEFEFSKNSIAQLYESGLIGGKAIAVIPAFDGADPIESGDFLSSGIKPGLTDLVNQRLTPLQEKIEHMMVSADTLLTNFNTILDETTKQHIQQSVSTLSSTLNSFKETSESLNLILSDNQSNINTTLDNFSAVSKNLEQVSTSLSEADLDQTLKDLQTTISNVNTFLGGIERGEGSLGKLITDEGLYSNLEGATKQLEKLLEDIKLNPKRYVHFSLFGKKQQPYLTPDLETSKD